MALTWDVKNVKDAWREISKEEYNHDEVKLALFTNPRYEEGGKYYEMKTETNMMIFICGLFSGIPNVTEDNHARLYERIVFLENTQGSTYLSSFNATTKVRESTPMTLDLVRSVIGLKTNGTEMTKVQFIKRATSSLEL